MTCYEIVVIKFIVSRDQEQSYRMGRHRFYRLFAGAFDPVIPFFGVPGSCWRP